MKMDSRWSPPWKGTNNFLQLILIRVYPFTDDLEIKGSQGLIQPVEQNAWTITFPTLKDRDMIIRFTEDGIEEFRYEVLNVTRNKLFFAPLG